MQFKRLGKSAISACAVVMLMPALAAEQHYSDLKSNGDLNLRALGSFFLEGTCTR
jgi:hypothetical protein